MKSIKGISKSAFKRALADACSCAVQYTGWPCPTCFGAGFDESAENWHAVLAYRGDYDKQITGKVIRMAVEIEYHPDGSFKRHIFAEIPLAEVERRIRRMAGRLFVTGGTQ
jgi:hypothetical protein